MSIYKPELQSFGKMPNLPIYVTHPNHIAGKPEDLLALGHKISVTGEKIGADAAVRSGSFADTMLAALDQVSDSQQFASKLNQMAITDPDSVDAHDITIAQAKARLMMNITQSVLNRVVQSWRDLINTR